jgi:hypothetical protein
VDHGSTNGSALAGQPLIAERPVVLAEGAPLVLGGIVQVRLFFSPSALRRTLGTERPVTRRISRRDALERLHGTLRSLGFAAEYHEPASEVTIQSGSDRIRTSIESSVFVVEWGQGQRYLKRKTTSLFGADAEDRLRELVFEFLGFNRRDAGTRPTEPIPIQRVQRPADALAQTEAD